MLCVDVIDVYRSILHRRQGREELEISGGRDKGWNNEMMVF